MIDVVGLGDGGFEDLPTSSRKLVVSARVLLGGRRQLALVPPVAGQERHHWPSPLLAALPAFLASHDVEASAASGVGIVALASGDPLHSGIGSTLISLLGPEAVRVHPTVSSTALARARMGWAQESTEVVSVVGRTLSPVRRHLHPGQRLVVLCSDGATPAAVAGLLREAGCGASVLTAWWHLGGPEEGARAATADRWDDAPTPDLVVVCVVVDREGALGRPGLGPAPGRPEVVFDHDGQITRRELRAAALAHLRPTPGAHLWDLGAGSGSIGIEWALAAPAATATAVERDPVRGRRIVRNADHLGAGPWVQVTVGESLSALSGLPTPDAVFIGGGLTAELVDQSWRRLTPGGRVVAHAVTLGTEAELVAAWERWGGELTRIGVEHARPLGRHLSWTPVRPVVQWCATKPVGPEPDDAITSAHPESP